MKLLITLALIVVATSAQAFVGNVGSSTSMKYDGTVETVEKQFLNVRNSDASSISSGTPVTLDLSDDDGASVTISATEGYSPLCVMAETCAAGKLCSCQNYGLMDTARYDSGAGSAVAGKMWFMSSLNAGYIAARGTVVASDVPGGIFYDAATASGNVQIFINLK